jgi:hypothetical protein
MTMMGEVPRRSCFDWWPSKEFGSRLVEIQRELKRDAANRVEFLCARSTLKDEGGEQQTLTVVFVCPRSAECLSLDSAWSQDLSPRYADSFKPLIARQTDDCPRIWKIRPPTMSNRGLEDEKKEGGGEWMQEGRLEKWIPPMIPNGWLIYYFFGGDDPVTPDILLIY